MHWEKIPLMEGGKKVLWEHIDALDKDIPVRVVRLRQKDGREVFYCEKLVSDTEKPQGPITSYID
jgi:hypothetical protein